MDVEPRVAKLPAVALQSVLAPLDAVLFTGLDTGSLLWLRTRIDDYRRAVDHLLAARHLIDDADTPDASSR
jgi:hypothetical protein